MATPVPLQVVFGNIFLNQRLESASLHRDIRDTALYREAEDLHRSLRSPGTGHISDIGELDSSKDGRYVVFAGYLMDALEGSPLSRVCFCELSTGNTRVMTFGPHSDTSPKFSPCGRYVAFLSDRRRAGDFQLHILELATGVSRPTPAVLGWAESVQWSPNGQKILLRLAAHGADVSGVQGAITSRKIIESPPSWMPDVQGREEGNNGRSAWAYDITNDRCHPVTPGDVNVWDAVWCGNDAIAAVTSSGSGEGWWYSAKLQVFNFRGHSGREIFRPENQLGSIAGSVSGEYLAVVEGIASDRGVVAGDLRLIHIGTGNIGTRRIRSIDARGVDVAFVEWRSDRALLVAGHRGFETVTGVVDAETGRYSEVWKSSEITSGSTYVTVSGLGDSGDCVIAGESFTQAPEIAVIQGGQYQRVKRFDSGYAEHSRAIESVERVSWQAPDGLEIQGWLLLPAAKAPHRLVMNIHGGPVWQWRPRWFGRAGLNALMMIKHGIAVFFPNPRGSAGNGQPFIRHVLGEMGGADTHDFLSGLDHLVSKGIADPQSLGVTGGSYGGYMTSWLITQDPRFAAAVSVSPMTNLVSEHLLSNIPHCVSLFMADHYSNPGGKYFSRSPVMHAHRARTPTLNICGALDRCTPAAEAIQFHHALMENNVESVLVTYPEEGHGIRKFPALTDFAARSVSWFEDHLRPAAAR